MKAAIYSKYGPPEVVQVEEIEQPTPNEDELLIKVRASTVNRTDCGFRSANYFVVRFFSGLLRPKRQVLGCEFAGEIMAVGSKISKYSVGEKVFGFNDVKFGGHGQYLVLNENDPLARIPENIGFAEAACSTEGAHYALCDIRAAKIAANQRVLVYGATGAIGSAAVQLIKNIGAHVSAVCATKQLKTIVNLGADEVIDYTVEDFTKCPERFDVVFDAVGKSSFSKCKPILKANGIYMSTELGPNFENPFLAIYTPLLGGKKVLFPLPSTKQSDLDWIQKLLAEGLFKPLVDRSYKLDEIVEAYRYVETGQKIGNVILEME